MGESVNPEVHTFDTLRDASRAVAERIAETARVAIAERGRFSIALSGGKTPELLYGFMADEYASKMEWTSVYLFWGDERFVPQDHPDNNFRMAHQAWISKVRIPTQNVYRIHTEEMTPEKAAESYEEILADFFKDSEEMSSSTFDVILLGIGVDGHTASLYPGNAVLSEKNRWVVPVDAPPSIFPKKRITLTLPLINRSRDVIFLALGEEKKSVIHAILKEPEKAKKIYPAARIKPRERLLWYVDKRV
jgi:6-phosphogluconolactonase